MTNIEKFKEIFVPICYLILFEVSYFIFRCAAPSKIYNQNSATNISVRCTFKNLQPKFCYKYFGALHLWKFATKYLLQIFRCAAPLKIYNQISATNISVLCTFNNLQANFCYKYFGALHLKLLPNSVTNIPVLRTFKKHQLFSYKYSGAKLFLEWNKSGRAAEYL